MAGEKTNIPRETSPVKNSKDKGAFFQPKLSINQPGDAYEQEADGVADKVMRMADPSCTDTFFKPAITPIQRKCGHCEEEEKKAQRKEIESLPAVQLKTDEPHRVQTKCSHCEEEEQRNVQRKENDAEPRVAAVNIDQVTQGSGEKMDRNTLGFMEKRFGYNFSDVQIHRDQQANESSANINALAYTTGNHIVFGKEQYQPGTDAGKKLIAHELTHVVQQKAAKDAVFRACGPDIGTPQGCTENSMPVPERPRYLFNVSCDDFREGNELDLRADAASIQQDELVEIHGLASEEGDLGFNMRLSCARALKAKAVVESVLAARGIRANIVVFSHGPQAGGASINRSVAVIRHVAPTPDPEVEPEPQPQTPPSCSGIYSDGHDETNDSDHDLDQAHHAGERSPDVVLYDYVGGESGALLDFNVGFFGGTFFESTGDDDALFNHFTGGNGSRMNFSTSTDMASIIGGSSDFTPFAQGFEQAVNDYITNNNTLCGFDGDAYLSANRPGYFHDPLFAWAVMGGYSRIEARVMQTASGISVRYKIFDHFGAGVSDAWSYLLGLSAMYYLQHFHGVAGTSYTPFIWSVEIERTSP